MSEEKKFEELIQAKMSELLSKVDTKAESSEIEKLKMELDELRSKATNETIANLQKANDDLNVILVKHGEQLTELKQSPAPKGYPSIKEAITAAFLEKKEELEQITKGKQTATLEVKVIDMGIENTIGSGSTVNLLTTNTGKISTVISRALTYMAAVSTGTIGTSRALWVEETDELGTPIFIAEAAGKTNISVKYVEKTESVKKIAVYGKVTTEMMSDLPQLVSYIQNNLMKRVDLAAEQALLTSAGTGEDPNGMESYATAFAAGGLANSVVGANELDVIEAVALQVKLAYGQPSNLFVHPSTMSKIKLIKDQSDRPVWKDYITIDGSMKVSGMNIIETTAIDAGDFLGGDTSVVNCLIRESLNIQIGLDGNDFTNNKKTILCEKRLVQYVSANDTPVLVKGDFTTAIAALNAA